MIAANPQRSTPSPTGRPQGFAVRGRPMRRSEPVIGVAPDRLTDVSGVTLGRVTPISSMPLVLPPEGCVVMINFGDAIEIAHGYSVSKLSCGAAMIFARPGPAGVTGAAASCLTLAVARIDVQIAAGARLGDPVRLAAANVMVPPSHCNGTLFAAIEQAVAAGSQLPEQRIIDWLAQTLATEDVRGTMLLQAKSVRRAITYIVDNAECDIDDAGLAAASGVTLRTLREGFLACMGVPLFRFVQRTRLDRARMRLASGRDVRSITEVAHAAGFAAPSAFGRAYVKAFGEPPTATRARAARCDLSSRE